VLQHGQQALERSHVELCGELALPGVAQVARDETFVHVMALRERCVEQGLKLLTSLGTANINSQPPTFTASAYGTPGMLLSFGALAKLVFAPRHGRTRKHGARSEAEQVQKFFATRLRAGKQSAHHRSWQCVAVRVYVVHNEVGRSKLNTVGSEHADLCGP